MQEKGEGLVTGVARFVAPALVTLCHFLIACASLTIARWSNGLAAIWLPNAVLLAYLLLTPRRRWTAAILGVIASGTAANTLGGAPLPLGVAFGISNGAEPLLVAWLLQADRRNLDLERIDDLGRFVLALVLVDIGSATYAAAISSAFYAAEFAEVWISWFSSSFLGLAIFTPLLLIVAKQRKAPRLTARDWREGFAVLALVAGFGAIGLTQSRWPLFFVMLPPVLIATFRLRAIGAAASVLLLAVMGTASIIAGLGSTAVGGGSFGERLILLQLFLAVAILTALPVAALLSQRDRYAATLRDREAQLASIVDAVSDVIFRTDAEGRWTYLNPAWEQLTGHAVEESIGRPVIDQVVEEDRDELRERMRGFTSGLFDTMRHQFRFRHESGDYRWGEVQARRLQDAEGRMIGAAGIIVDISDRLAVAALAEDARRRAEKEAEAALLLAATDDLTGVASRRAFLTVLDQHLRSEEPLAIALFDIDRFKLVNDRYGHAIGDEVLRGVAEIAESCIRERDLVGRLGGEEFAVLMPGASLAQTVAVGERLRRACEEAEHPFGLTVTVSLGVAAAGEGVDSAALLRQADAALYRAKFEGRNCLRLAA
ncbi:diguanylate cyclase [Sphingomonas sp.]|jgi:diguanylate cyclase (GGDEF)-like protein/PAS domain S-box-containing protein|uniref:sensor domain-containing diguanylate cyclase n=1 Tax=Sphingomonas sp. TaxID=28214 RepID=UPI002DE9BA77|nr:diguanylate cyclase [Sphingomonas sp.]HEV2569097.1 diguanylate cyclase [Sphingomonas sp.]